MEGFMCFLLLILSMAVVITAEKDTKNENVESRSSDLETSATSAKLLNLGSLFGQLQPSYPTYPYGYGSYLPNTNYRPYYSTPTNGYYPNYNTNYPSTGWTGSNYYPTQGYYGTGTGTGIGTSTGSYYPSTGGYYPTNGYYPTTGTGTNILGGNGGYGGYGGNGGLREYYGYWDPEYTGRRNRGYGYYTDTDRYGLPQNRRGMSDYHSNRRERDRVPGNSRGYD